MMIPVCLWSLCIQVMKLPVALCILFSKVLPNSSRLPAKLCKHHYDNHTACKDKDISFFFFSLSLRHSQTAKPLC
jgi:hypothetical protein